jgi:hypothetical protein
MGKLSDDVIDLAVRLRGATTAEELAGESPRILAGVRRAAAPWTGRRGWRGDDAL